MSNFDNTINKLLENLIFEQGEDEFDAKTVFYKTIEEIKNKLQNDPQNFLKESESKYNSDDSGFLSRFQNIIQSSNEDIKEQVDQKSGWEKAKEFGGYLTSKADETVGPAIQGFGEFAAEKIGETATAFGVKEYMDNIENNVSESFWYKLAAVFEPSGVMSWPYYNNALKLYEEHKGTKDENVYFLNLLAAQIAVIPGVRLPIGILTAPFKIIKNPFMNIFGNTARRTANEIASKVGKGKAAAKAKNSLETAGVGGKFTNKIKQGTKAAIEKTKEIAKKTAKGTAAAAKTATVVSSGDFPETWRKWTEGGKKAMEDVKPTQGTLGAFPRFNEISTQGF